MMTNFGRSLVAVLCLALVAGVCAAGPVDDAKALLKEKKYDEVDKVLEKALAAKTPDVEALKVSLEAAMASGRFISAQARVTALLVATDNKDANLVYMGADIADAAGDTRMALSRYLAFSQGQDQASERVEYALRYLLAAGAYPEEFKKYVKLYGATDKSWRFGATQLDRLLDIPDPVRARDLADALITLFPQPGRVQHVHNRLRTAADSMALGKDPKDRYQLPTAIMVKGKPLDYTPLLTMLRAADANLVDVDRLKLTFAMQAAAKGAMDGEQFSRFYAMRTVPAAEDRLKVGKEFLALENTYKDNADPNFYYSFVRLIATLPEVFNIKDNALVSGVELIKKYDTAKAKFTGPAALGELVGLIGGNYVGNNADKISLFKANLAVLPVNNFRELVSLSDPKELDTLLADSQKVRPFGEMVTLRYNVIDFYSRLADAEVKAEAAAKAAADQTKVVVDQATAKSTDADKAAATAATKAAEAKAAATKAEEAKAKDAADKTKAAAAAADASTAAAAAAKTAKDALVTAQTALKTAQGHFTAAGETLASARTKLSPAIVSAVKDYLACNPGNFDINNFKNIFLGNSLVSEDDRYAVLKDLIVRGGPGANIDALIKDLAKDKKTADNPKFQDVAKALEARKPGSDPLMAAHVTLCSYPTNQPQPRKEIGEAVAKCFAAYKGNIPAELTTTQDVLMANLMWKHLEHVNSNRDAVVAWIQTWTPRAANDNYFDQLAWRARQMSSGMLFNMAQQYVASLNGNGKEAIWRSLCGATNPKGNTASPFAKVYDKMGFGNALAYVLNQKDTWDSNRPVLIAEMAKVAAMPGFKPADRAQASAAITQLFAWASPENKAPATLVATLWNYILADEEATKSYDVATEAAVYAIYARSGLGADAAKHLSEYFKVIAKRTPAEQFNAIGYLYKLVSLPREKDANLVAGSSIHTLLKVLAPLAQQGAKDAWAGYVVQERVYGEVAALLGGEAKEFEPLKGEARAMASVMVDMLAAGAPYDGGSPGGMLSLADVVMKDALDSENWALAGRLMNFYAGALGYEMSWETNYRVRIQPLTKAMEAKSANELSYIFISSIERRNKPWDKVHQQMLVIKAKAARGIPGMIPVKSTEVTYDLHLAAQALSLGDEVKAWELTERKLKLLAPNWESLDPEYVAWTIEQMRRQKMLKEALDLAFSVLTREADLPAEVAGKISLAKGDIYKDMENYNAARIEYEGLRNNKRYNKTEAGTGALYHLIDLLILTKDYSGAEGQLERLTDSENVNTQAEAYFLYAKMAYLQADYKASKEFLKKVKERVVNHVEAAFLEGELNLRLPGGLQNTEVKVGDPRLSTVVIPGRVLTLKLQDTNLGVARGGAAIPVILRTSKGGDVEHIKLMPSSSDKYLFVGTINTAIGKVAADDLVLQIRGDDVVSYQIDPEFQKANDLNYPPKNLEVRYPGRLVASSGEILTEEEEEKLALERQLHEKQPEISRRLETRDGRTVRPGGGIYVQVTDFTRDVSDAADKLSVSLKTSSGDAIESFELTETGEHTGIFRGVVPTGIPLPKATASDTAEGKDASFLINSTKKQSWSSLADAKKPKWVEVDTMSSHPVKQVSIKVDGVEQVKQAVLLGLLADDFDEIASLVEKTDAQKGGLTVETAVQAAGSTPEAMMRHLKLSKSAETHQDGIAFDRNDTSLKGQSGQMTNRIRGVFWLNEDRAMEFKFTQPASPNDWQTVFLFIDGMQVMGGTMNKTTLEWTKRVDLVKGAHKLEILVVDSSPVSKVILSVGKDDGTFEPMPANLFSIKENPPLAQYLRPKGKIEVKDGCIVATLSEPVRLRRLRWVFEDFTGNAITASDFTIRDEDGKTVTPCANDFSTGLTNSTLEIAPGDKITVSYNDDKRLGDQPPTLTANLNASFHNGDVQVAFEDFVGKQNRQAVYSPAMRCRSGDQLMVIVTDYDEDATDERDTVEVTVRTSSGEQVKLKALETAANGIEASHKHAGVFMALLRLGDKTEKDTLKVKLGDIITATYLDRENTTPGIPIERSYNLVEAGRSGPKMMVYRTTVIPVEDKSEDAQAKLTKMKLKNKDISVIYRDQVIARHPDYRDPKDANARPASQPTTQGSLVDVSVSAPLLVEVNYPKMALNSGSILTLSAASESELRAAAREKRKPVTLDVPMYIESIEGVARAKGYAIRLLSQFRQDAKMMLRDGTFAGVIRMQIGSPGDPIDDLVTTGEKQFATAAERDEDTRGMQYRVPTLLVSGSDIVHLQIKDADSNEIVRQKVRLLSDGRIELLDQSYTAQMEAIHLGERFFVKVTDPDRDVTDDRDDVKVTVRSSSGDTSEMTLTETLAHSGVFTGLLCPEYSGQAATSQPSSQPAVAVTHKTATSRPRIATTTSGPASAPADTIVVNFGDKVTFEYLDERSLIASEPRKVSVDGRIFFGADGELAVFSKQFKDPEMAVKTRFLMAEALFEMAKEHRKLKRDQEAKDEIGKGKQILEEALQDYPNTSLASQGEFLLANLAEELGNYQEAIARYAHVISTWSESEFAARSQFKKAVCLERMENYDAACEEYVKLTYVYPDSTQVADATVRLGNYYYKKQNYKVAGRIFFRFQQRTPGHKLASKSLFLSAQCYYKLNDFKEAVRLFDMTVSEYPDDKEVRPEAMYWLADSYFKDHDNIKAYQNFKKLTWDYPDTKWAKIARGRLTEEVFARIEE